MERANLDWSHLTFSYTKTDYHLEYRFKDGQWDEGKEVEDDHLQLSIAATCLHYGQQAFEGLKVFEHKDGRISAFRPDENAKRLRRSAEKILMAPFPEEKFLGALERIVRLNKRFIPPYGTGAALYIRPLLIGTSGMLGVQPAKEYMFVLFAIPVGPYFKTGVKPIKLQVIDDADRAAPDGVGDVKVGGNYAASLRVAKRVKEAGFSEALYLDARHKEHIDESGPANFYGITKDNTYVTPDSPSILPSITNKSLMTLAKEELGMTVEKREMGLKEIYTLKEAGCCGTAAVITPVKSITYGNEETVYCKGDQPGEITMKLYNMLKEIQVGDREDKYGWNYEIILD